jgi:hypothetical protein
LILSNIVYIITFYNFRQQCIDDNAS